MSSDRPGEPGDRRRHLLSQAEMMPDQPGVYLFRGPAGEVLYVGKAQSLRARVRSYFQASRPSDHRKGTMVELAANLEYIVTRTAVEALIVEATLIKKHHPRYNITLRDDKQYPYVRIGLDEQYASVRLVRTREADGARYFGPYTQSRALRETLRILRTVFPYRSCATVRERERACLNRFIGRCLGPCQGDVTPAEYREMIDGLILFMTGRQDQVRVRLTKLMGEAAAGLDFESAGRYRDQIRSLDAVVEGQKSVTSKQSDCDVVAVALDAGQACAQVFFFRRGRLVGRDSFFLRGAAEGGEAEAAAAFLEQYYSAAAEIPPEVLVSVVLDERAVIEDWLTKTRGSKVVLRTPVRGEGRRLAELAMTNARLALDESRHRREIDPARTRQDLVELQTALELPDYPHRIECFDVSNIQGQDAVASMVVFEGGHPRKSDYRRFKLRTPGPDDYAMLAEALQRRFRTGREPAEASSFAVIPDLLIVDGGRGQAAAALAALAAAGLSRIPVFGLAKAQELLYPPGEGAPVVLPGDSGALFVLTRLRDEAHRFAVSYHRSLRARRSLASALDDIPGIGPRRRTALLRHFGSGRAVRQASLAELLAVPHLPSTVASALYDHFHPPQVVSPEDRREGET